MEANPGSPNSSQIDSPEATDFQHQLSTLKTQRCQYVEQNEVRPLKDDFHILLSSFRTVQSILNRKGLIHEDPYKNDKKISEVAAPSNAPFLESEAGAQMGIRLSEFDSQLDFLVNYYQFSVDFLNLTRLKDVAALTNYIRWGALSKTSENMTSRVLAELLEKVKNGGDQISVSLLNDAHEQLAKTQRNIIDRIKRISDLQVERYKLFVRTDILTRLPQEALKADPESEEAVRAVKKQFARLEDGKPFYPDLVKEVLLEDRAADAERRRRDLLSRLRIEQKVPQKKKTENQFRRQLLEAVRTLASCSRSLDACITKLEDNNKIIENRRLTFIERIRRWAMKALRRKHEKSKIEVRYVDITTKATHSEKIDFPEFCANVRGKSRLFASALNRNSSLAQKLETAADDQILSFFGRNINELRLIHRRLDSLDNYFKSAATSAESNQIRGIKIELTALKNEIIRANQKRHDFVSKQEEVEQLKRLGVDAEE